MKIAIIIIVILAASILFVFIRQYDIIHNNSDGGFATTKDLPALVELLIKSKENGSFFVVLLTPA
jgi:hypothetical protein